MKSKHGNLLLSASAVVTLIVSSLTTEAATFYWDGNGITPGFGTAGGTWSSQSVTSGAGRWVTSATGEIAGSATQTTSSGDTFNYGTATVGLAAGTITIGGTSGTPINLGSVAFGAASGAITLNGGFLAFGASKFITVNNATNTISSVIQGTNGFTKNGSGNLVLTGNLAHTGTTTIANSGTLVLSGDNSSMSGTVSLSTAGTGSAAPKLDINSATAIGTGTLSFGGGAATDTVRIDNSSAGAITLTTNNALTLNRNFTFVGTQSLNLGTGAATLGGMTTGTNRTITVSANTLTLGGNIGEAVSNLGITKAGAGTLVLGGANTFTRGVVIGNNTGIIRITNAGALGSGNVTISTTGTGTGTLELSLAGTNSVSNTFNGFASATALTNSGNAQILNTSGTNTITSDLTVTATGGNGLNVASNGGLLTLAGTITHTVASGRTLSLGGTGNGVVSGAINDSSGGQVLAVNKSGAGTWTISGAKTYSGATTVTAGTLALDDNLSLQNSALVTTGAGSVTLEAGVTTPTFGGLNGATGNLATVISSGYGSVTALTLNPLSGTVTYGGQIADGAAGMTVTKTGAGTQILSGTNTYTGATTVSAGTLFITGSLSGNISVSDNATVGGGGTVGDISFAGGSFLDIALALGGSPDALTTGAISFASAGFGVDNLVFNGTAVDWSTVAAGTYTLLTGTLNSLNLDNFGLANAFDIGGGRTAHFESGSLNLVVIPEPGTALLAGLGSLLLIRRRRSE